jgi:FAS-associated factor 2
MTDLDALSPDQREKLVMFSEVTANARDQNSAVGMLQACNWNVEQALQLHWASGDDAGSASASQATAPPPRESHTEQLLPAKPGIIGQFFLLIWRVVSIGIHFVFSFIFGSGPEMRGGGEATGALLGNALTAQYGSRVTLPKFFPGSFAQAVQTARKDVKLLVVYLHSDMSRFTQQFCTEVLSNEFIRMMLDENFLLWGGDIARYEVHQLAQMVHARQFPCFCVLLPASVEEIRVIGALHGDVGREATTGLLTRCLEEMETHRSEIIARQEQHKEDRSLRESQDQEYLEAMEMDRKREEERRAQMAQQMEAERVAAEERKIAEAQQAKLEAEMHEREEHRRSLANSLQPPGPDATSNVCIRLPAGQRVAHKFRPDDTLADVYRYASCLAHLPENAGRGLIIPPHFMLRTSFPSRDLTDMESTIHELQLSGAAVLLAEIEDD